MMLFMIFWSDFIVLTPHFFNKIYFTNINY